MAVPAPDPEVKPWVPIAPWSVLAKVAPVMPVPVGEVVAGVGVIGCAAAVGNSAASSCETRAIAVSRDIASVVGTATWSLNHAGRAP
jgi:hypothetical protein